MSLINEALKKAQRLRHEQAVAAEAGAAEGGPVQRRNRPMRAQTLIVLIAGGAALVVVSVVITVALLTSEPDPITPSRPAPTVAPASPADTSTSSPIIVAPVIPAPAETEKDKAAVTPTPATPGQAGEASSRATAPGSVSADVSAPAVATPATPLPAEPRTETATSSPPDGSTNSPAPAAASGTAEAAAPLAPTIAPSPPTADPRIQQFVDGIRVTGIRSSGTDSKVLMNDRVYRVNDMVERSLGVRLVEVAPDRLTFADANGFTYVKTF